MPENEEPNAKAMPTGLPFGLIVGRNFRRRCHSLKIQEAVFRLERSTTGRTKLAAEQQRPKASDGVVASLERVIEDEHQPE